MGGRVQPQAGAGDAPVVTLVSASRSFGALQALADVDLDIRAGECIGLVGHNGAGKSTLVNLVTGLLKPSGGQVIRAGGAGPAEAGIRAVSQEGTLCLNLTALENLQITQPDLRGRGWRRLAASRIQAALDDIFPGHHLRPDQLVGDMTLAEQQMIEIAVGFAQGPAPVRLVVLDEPTSSLDASISAQLLAHVARFCAEGGAVIFITHMLGEVFSVASRIVVMKDGRKIADRPAGDLDRQRLVDLMGHVAQGHDAAAPGGARSTRSALKDAAPILTTPEGITARRGEIVGLAGLAGHGQAEALARYFLASGTDWRARARPKAAFVAGDRRRDGVMPGWSIRWNLSLAALSGLVGRGMIDRKAETALAQDWKRRIDIRSPDLGNPLLSLSGGNQQKVLFARALATPAEVIVMDDPMRGVDVGTKSEVYAMIRREADAGRTFLWYSTEMDEIGNCDRVYVFRDGTISAELEGDAITEENILAASFEFGDHAA
ncbi:MAG: sugar ABC transporter ATP-binding protein [Paracoccus sp. (in: a-proteobacteria)]|nr:sugar ABC transporter ATP-binding protein [Paracoccus sp. (in: a-proteobacteria)]